MGNSSSVSSILEKKLSQNERIYREACAVFGGDPHVFRYYDPADEVSIDLLTVENTPLPNVVSYSTLGLIHYPREPVSQVPASKLKSGKVSKSKEKPCRIEICVACRRKYEYLPELLSACSFDIMNARFLCRQGSVYKDIINTYIQGSPLKHVLFISVSDLWGQALPTLEFDDKQVTWLYALPISDGELDYLQKHSTEELLTLFRANRIEPYCWERNSVV